MSQVWGQGWLASHPFMLSCCFSCCCHTLPLPLRGPGSLHPWEPRLQVWPSVCATAGTQQTGNITHFFTLFRWTVPAPRKKPPLRTCRFKPLRVTLPWAAGLGGKAGPGGTFLPASTEPVLPRRVGWPTPGSAMGLPAPRIARSQPLAASWNGCRCMEPEKSPAWPWEKLVQQWWERAGVGGRQFLLEN